ncbi:MAG: InlB B-repeat-containing protein [Christensenellaceae bacterium]|nr:InlB B-repeat-containing protein [Christensenellaceae bacterium]
MKKKTLISVVALILAFVLSLTVLTACKKNKGQNQVHEHSFSETWENDVENHWHVCTGEGCTEISAKAAHTWDSGVITQDATETEDGVKTFTCTVCGRTRTESISALGYTMAFDSQGGSAVASIVKDAGEEVTAPADPERTGFVFLGWFADKDQSVFEGATPYVFDKMPEANVTLYAKWALKLAVSYNGHDTTVAMTSFNVTEANEDVMFVVDFEKINSNKSYIGVPMYRYEGETRIGLDTEVAKEDSEYVSAVYDAAFQNVYAEDDVLYRYGAGDFYIKHNFSENGRYFISIKYATPGEYEIGVEVFNWKATPTLELKDGVNKNKTYDGQPVSVTADDYTTNSDGEVTLLWYDGSKNALANAPVNTGTYYFKLKVAETSTANGDETDFCAKVTADYYEVVISPVEVRVETPHNFTYNGNREYYVDYSTSAVNGESLKAYFVFGVDNSNIWLDDWGFEIWGETTEYSYNYTLVYEGSGDMATLNKKVISDLTLRVNYNGTTSFTGITGDKATSTDIAKNAYGINDFEKLIFSVITSSKNVSATAYTVDFANVVIGGEAAPFYTLAESGSASVYIDRKELTNLSLTTTEAWTDGGSFEITLTEKDGICSGEVVKVTVTNYGYQDMFNVGDYCNLVLSDAVQGQEEIAFVESDDYDNYVLVGNDNGIVGKITLTGVSD